MASETFDSNGNRPRGRDKLRKGKRLRLLTIGRNWECFGGEGPVLNTPNQVEQRISGRRSEYEQACETTIDDDPTVEIAPMRPIRSVQ